MKKLLLSLIISVLTVILVSCGVQDCELPTTDAPSEYDTSPLTTEPPEYATTGYNCCATTDYPLTTIVYTECTTQNTEPTGETEILIPPNVFSTPEDEMETSVTYHVSVADGPTMKITLYGYKSEMMGEELYFKNNEPIELKVEIKNETNAPIYQWQPTACHSMKPSHEHELDVSFSDANGNKLTNARLDYFYFFMACPEAIEIWSLAPGESYEWDLCYFVGTAKESVIWKDPICDTEFSMNFDLYGCDIFTDGVCTFEGSIDFAFTHTANRDKYGNTDILALPLSLKVFYVGK